LALKSTLVDAQGDAEKTEYPLKSSAHNLPSDGWPFESRVFCRAHWVLLAVKG
jgi:hypothetical protein